MFKLISSNSLIKLRLYIVILFLEMNLFFDYVSYESISLAYALSNKKIE